MSRVFAFREYAPAGQVFDPDAVRYNVGKTFTLSVAAWSGQARLVRAEVAEDLKSVLLTVEPIDDVPVDAFASAAADVGQPWAHIPRQNRRSDVLHGEVVDPNTVYLCGPGQTRKVRKDLDAVGRFGGVVREAPWLPDPSQVYEVWADGEEVRKLDLVTRFGNAVPSPNAEWMRHDWGPSGSAVPPWYGYGLFANSPSASFRFNGTVS